MKVILVVRLFFCVDSASRLGRMLVHTVQLCIFSKLFQRMPSRTPSHKPQAVSATGPDLWGSPIRRFGSKPDVPHKYSSPHGSLHPSRPPAYSYPNTTDNAGDVPLA